MNSNIAGRALIGSAQVAYSFGKFIGRWINLIRSRLTRHLSGSRKNLFFLVDWRGPTIYKTSAPLYLPVSFFSLLFSSLTSWLPLIFLFGYPVILMHRSLPRLTPAFRYRRPVVLSSSSSRPLSTRTAAAATSRNHLKPLSVGVGLASASFLYYYSQRDDDRTTLLGLLRKVDAEAAPISAFSTSNASTTIAELLDDNSRACMHAKSTEELLLALFVYKLCTFPWLVDAAPHLIKLAESLKLEQLAYWVVKGTFFRQFCGGETPEDCISTMDRLARSGINCILDLSVEADLHVQQPSDDVSTFAHQEQQADFILDMTKHSIRTAARGQQYGLSGALVAVKVTALTPVELLLRINQALTTLDKQFHEHQKEGVVGAASLRQIVNKVMPTPASDAQAQQRESILSSLEAQSAQLDYIEFCKLFNMGNANRNIWWDTNQTSKNNTMLTKEELAAYDRMMNRLDQISNLARELKAGIMIDAEQSYFQEAIDHVTLNLQQKYNRRDMHQPPTVYNTCKFSFFFFLELSIIRQTNED